MNKERLEEFFSYKGAASNNFNIAVTGNKNIYVEGVESIKEISDTSIKIRVKKFFVGIKGEALSIEYINDGEISVNGKIKGIDII